MEFGVWTVWGCGQVSFILIRVQTDAINTGNEWRTEEPLKEEVTGLWEPAILLVCRWPNTYFPPSFANKFLKNPTMWFSGFFFLFCLSIVEVIPMMTITGPLHSFLSGRTCTIGGWLNTFLPHCMCFMCMWLPCSCSAVALMTLSWYIVLCGSSGSERIVCSLFTPVKLSVGCVKDGLDIQTMNEAASKRKDTVEMSGFGVNVFVGHGILHTYNKAVYKTSHAIALFTHVVWFQTSVTYFILWTNKERKIQRHANISFANHFVAMLFIHYLFILVYLFVYLFTKCIIDLFCLFFQKKMFY